MQPYLPYILLLGAVVIVGALVMPRKKQEAAMPPQTMENMENALEQFMENMEKDNEELVLLVRNAQQESKSDALLKEQRIAQLEAKCEQLQDTLDKASRSTVPPTPAASSIPIVINQTQTPVFMPAELPTEEVTNGNTIQARYKDLFLLYEQGKSIEIISKKLGMNKGEVQLIIQLAKQEEASHA
ncbi:DUF6115 domain-containing protein [Paenibacillus sinopodophylli]|uniref:DUF6115 domain-containing protein n=1 Tax=Paenibacillus sinopodophylli TaxID=1837342 RepID=UPI00110CB0B5|nr:hypothetical protein [Paenibacillus sinopodophylli]